MAVLRAEDDAGPSSPRAPHPSWWVVAPLALLGCMVLFNLGHAAIDRAEPDRSTAGWYYSAALVVAAGAVAGLAILRAPSLPVLLLGAMVLGGFSAMLLFPSTEAYNEEQPFLTFFFSDAQFFGLVFLVTAAIAIGVLSFLNGGIYALRGLSGILLSAAFAFAWLAVAHLTQLDHQAELARDAYEPRSVPAIGLPLTLAVLAVLAVVRRRQA